MEKIATNKIHIIIIVSIALLCTYVGSRAWQKYTNAVKVRNIAEQIGYESSMNIAQVHRCFDIFARCYEQLFYQTNLTQDEFKLRLNYLPWKTLNDHDLDGYIIFTAINFGTTSRLTVNGHDAMGDRSQLPKFKGNKWSLRDPAGQDWNITYYPSAAVQGLIALNGVKLERNIVSIEYKTR